MISKISKTSKLISEYKSLEVKNEDNLVDKNSLLFAVNSAIGNLSIHLSSW